MSIHPNHDLSGNSPVDPRRGNEPRKVDSQAIREQEFAELLDRLKAQAEDLEQATSEDTNADPAPGDNESFKASVRQAAESFKDAMNLGERLLDAYRRNQIDSD